MGATASMPAARAGAWDAGLSHAHKVTRLYRASLRTSRDWAIDYELWVEDAAKIQARFRANADKSVTEGRFLVEKGKQELMRHRHPEPYIPIYQSGGSSYQRNVPPPPEVGCPPPCLSRGSERGTVLTVCVCALCSSQRDPCRRRTSAYSDAARAFCQCLVKSFLLASLNSSPPHPVSLPPRIAFLLVAAGEQLASRAKDGRTGSSPRREELPRFDSNAIHFTTDRRRARDFFC